jgi:D-ribose pyranase
LKPLHGLANPGPEINLEDRMKKIGILNQDISEVIAGMGHTDMLVVCDAGLPIPGHVRRIDLSLHAGYPSFEEVLRDIAKELQVERIILAEETGKVSPDIEKVVLDIFSSAKVQKISHEGFKELTHEAVAVVRTGEFTPYANVILVSGVVF